MYVYVCICIYTYVYIYIYTYIYKLLKHVLLEQVPWRAADTGVG